MLWEDFATCMAVLSRKPIVLTKNFHPKRITISDSKENTGLLKSQKNAKIALTKSRKGYPRPMNAIGQNVLGETKEAR
jgi:hypothetical protein